MDKQTQAKHDRRVHAASVASRPSTKKKIMLSAKDIYLKGV